MKKISLLTVIMACSVLSVPSYACDKETHAQHRAYIKSLQAQIEQNKLAVIKDKAALREAIKSASRDSK